MAKRTRSAAERAAQAEGLRSRPARGRLLAAARELATAHGYEQLRVGELAERAGVSRETFYTHFADKRACLAEARAPGLGEVEQLLRIATEEGEEWATPILAALDEQLARHFASELDPRARITSAMIELAAGRGHANVRLADIVKVARVSYPSFYRHFESKEQCFVVACRELVEMLEGRATAAAALDGAGSDAAMPPGVAQLRALARMLAGERDAARALLLDSGALAAGLAARDSTAPGSTPLGGLIARLIADGRSAAESEELPGDARAQMLSGALVETMREKLLAGRLAELPTAVDALIDALFEPATDSRSRPGAGASPHHRHSRRERRSPARAKAPQPTAA